MFMLVVTIASWVGGRSKLQAFEPLVTRFWENILVVKLLFVFVLLLCYREM